MFNKVIVAEDHEIRNLGVINTLNELQIKEYEFVTYCDEALHKIKTAINNNVPYDLLITDLNFDKDYMDQKITSGQQLIEEARKLQPDIAAIAFSIEKKPQIIDDLFKKYNVNAFVSKGRNDGKELRTTIKKVYAGEIVVPQEILNSIRNNSLEFSEYDVHILELLSKGWKQADIGVFLKENNFGRNSQSAIEKRLNELRGSLNAKNNIEMIVICKDLGII